MTAWDAINDIQNKLQDLVDYYMTFSDKLQQNYPEVANEISDKLRQLNLNLGKFINWLDNSNYLGQVGGLILGGVAIVSISTGYYYFISEINKTRQKIDAAKQMIDNLPPEQRSQVITDWLDTNLPPPTSSSGFDLGLGLGNIKQYIPIVIGVAGLLILYNITK